jgi:hypothetical protein
LIRDVYARAGLDPRETEVVEAHGTGTQAGDPIETAAISRVLGSNRDSGQKIRIGSMKTNVGHLEGASGVAGVIKAVLMLENRMILPSRNFKTSNPQIPLEEWNLKVCFSRVLYLLFSDIIRFNKHQSHGKHLAPIGCLSTASDMAEPMPMSLLKML